MCDYCNTLVEVQLQAEILHELPDSLDVFLLQSQPHFRSVSVLGALGWFRNTELLWHFQEWEGVC